MAEEKIEVISIKDRALQAQDGQKYNKAQREQNRILIAERRFQGVSFRDIAAELHVSVGYCYSEYKHIEEQWREEAARNLDDLKARELAKLDKIEQEAWKAWDASTKQATKITEDFGFKGAERHRTKAKATREDQVGNPKFLDIIAKCIDRRCKLLGLDSIDRFVSEESQEMNALEARLQRYTGVLGVIAVGTANALALDDGSGESMDSARSASEAGAILDVDGHEW